MSSFCARKDDGRSVVVDGCIVCSDHHGFGGCRAVARDICGLQLNESDEVMHRSRFVVPDLEGEGRDNLLDSCEVGVRRLPGDRLKFIERMSKFLHNLLGRLCPKMACLLSPGSSAAVFEVL